VVKKVLFMAPDRVAAAPAKAKIPSERAGNSLYGRIEAPVGEGASERPPACHAASLPGGDRKVRSAGLRPSRFYTIEYMRGERPADTAIARSR